MLNSFRITTVCGLIILSLLPLHLYAQGEELQPLQSGRLQNLEQTDGLQRGCRRGHPQHVAALHRQVLLKGKHGRAADSNPNLYIGDRRQLVVLAAFSDYAFAGDSISTLQKWDKIFNQEGYNESSYVGSVHDYFYDQSYSQFDLTFDLQYVTVGNRSKYRSLDYPLYDEYSQFLVHDIVDILKNRDIDWSLYDWANNHYVSQLLIVFAGQGQNDGGGDNTIWPHQWWLSKHYDPNTQEPCKRDTVDFSGQDYVIDSYCAVQEDGNSSSTFGTICHEYSHCFGLPDIYQTTGSKDIIVDEWDLMDGGNITNYGWCPPNYSALEKHLLGWLEFTELTEPVAITDMQPVADGGNAYLIRHTDNEYYLLENRQPSEGKWDYGLPGKGLVIWHVNYNENRWSSNAVNNNTSELGFQLVHADNQDYTQSSSSAASHYPAGGMMNSNYLSGSPYPYSSSDGTNNQLTDDSTPAATMYNANSADSKLLGKSITNIQMTADGLVSFDFTVKCATPTISLENGKVKFDCDTEDVKYVYQVTPVNASSYDENGNLSISSSYHVTAYATKDGYLNSDTVAKDIAMSVGEKGDVNGDGKVSITDAVNVVNIILNGGSEE